MNKNGSIIIALTLLALPSALHAQAAPAWVQNLEQAYPSREWVAVTAQGTSQSQAENAAMNALARAFKTDVASLTQTSQRMSQIVSDAAGKKSVAFDQSQNFSQDISASTNVRGLIGVQTDVYRAPDSAVYVNARMNRRESAARYSGMIRENEAVINQLLAAAARYGVSFEGYSTLSFAAAIAEVTDNFQNILEVLDPSAANRRPGYGGTNAIKTAMQVYAAGITIGIVVDTENTADAALFRRALGAFFTDKGFKINEQGRGNYVLRAGARFEELSQNVQTCRYYLDAALTDSGGLAVFTSTEDDRKNHPRTMSEARRLAVRAVETSIEEGIFAHDFDEWLTSLVD
ncbi:MAG: hypothetical protein LBI86_06520 [Treponema sp.]|jgi:hypothetical protein|nr:hypothetical protein [Treponema sp.]